MRDGWHLRVPLSVTNPLDNPVRDLAVGYDLKLNDLLAEAGWPRSLHAGGVRLESFELNVESVRVIEYRTLAGGRGADGIIVGAVPSKVTLGLRAETRPFHPRNQPDIHVEWVVPGPTGARETRHFFIYFDTVANDAKVPATYPEPEMAPLDAKGWISRGTTLFGVAQSLTLIGLHDGTLARVDAYSDGTAYAIPSGAGNFENPVELDTGNAVTLNLAQQPTLIRIVATHPVIAFSSPASGAHAGPIPSADGTLLGTRFAIPRVPAADGTYGPNPVDVGYVVINTGTTGTTVTTSVGLGFTLPPGGLRAVDYSSVPEPVHLLSATKPVLVLAWPSIPSKTQFPSWWGAPAGSRIVGIPHPGQVCSQFPLCDNIPPCAAGNLGFSQGAIIVTSVGGPVHVVGRDAYSGEIRLPGDTMAPRALTPGVIVRDPTQTQSGSLACPMLVHTTPDAKDASFSTKGSLIAYGGGVTPVASEVAGALGNSSAMSFTTFWPVYLVAFHNGTQIVVTPTTGIPHSQGLAQGGLAEVDAAPRSPTKIQATKPVALLSRVPGGYFAGIDESPIVSRTAPLQYRGYLISLDPAGGAREPLIGVAAPGRPVEYRLVLRNLAKDVVGNPVADIVDLTVDPLPDGWTGTLSESTVALPGGGERNITLTVTPPPSALEGTPLRLAARAASQGNQNMVDSVITRTVVRASYGVDVWFEREGGPKARVLTMDPGETRTLKVAVKNLALVPDRLVVRASPFASDWLMRLENTSGAFSDIQFGAGETRVLTYHVTAPQVNASQTLFEVSVGSGSDASAAAKVSGTLRIRAEVRIALIVDEPTVEGNPGEPTRIRVWFENRGSDRVNVQFGVTGTLPDGWSRPRILHSGFEIDELAAIEVGTRVPMDVEVLVPESARRGERGNLHLQVETVPQFRGDPVQREGVDLLVLTAAHHALVPVDQVDQVTVGWDNTVRATLVLENNGNGDELLQLVPTRVPANASVVLSPPTRVPAPGTGMVEATLVFPNHTAPGFHRVSIEIVSDDGATIPWEFKVAVPERRNAALTPRSAAESAAGVPRKIPVEIRNTGNVPLDIPPQLEVPDGWRVTWQGAPPRLDPGHAVVLDMEVTARAAVGGTFDVSPHQSWANGNPMRWTVYEVDLSAEAVLAGPTVRVELRNGGTGDAWDVDVRLLQSGQEVDRTVLRRVAAGGNASAILGLRATGAGFVVVVDGEARYGPRPIDIEIAEAPPTPRMVPTLTPFVIIAAVAGTCLLRQIPRRMT